jgi:hypothetical protein
MTQLESFFRDFLFGNNSNISANQIKYIYGNTPNSLQLLEKLGKDYQCAVNQTFRRTVDSLNDTAMLEDVITQFSRQVSMINTNQNLFGRFMGIVLSDLIIVTDDTIIDKIVNVFNNTSNIDMIINFLCNYDDPLSIVEKINERERLIVRTVQINDIAYRSGRDGLVKYSKAVLGREYEILNHYRNIYRLLRIIDKKDDVREENTYYSKMDTRKFNIIKNIINKKPSRINNVTVNPIHSLFGIADLQFSKIAYPNVIASIHARLPNKGVWDPVKGSAVWELSIYRETVIIRANMLQSIIIGYLDQPSSVENLAEISHLPIKICQKILDVLYSFDLLLLDGVKYLPNGQYIGPLKVDISKKWI